MGDRKQNRGNSPTTVRTIRTYLTINPGSSVDEIVEGTGLTRQTIASALPSLAEIVPRSWPRRWTLFSPIDIVVPGTKAVPLTQTWPRWIKAARNWPNAIGKLSNQDDPRVIAAGLEQLAQNAAALAVSFRAVQDEPDWLERLGA